MKTFLLPLLSRTAYFAAPRRIACMLMGVLLASLSVSAQESVSVKGVVKDKLGNPLIGVTVRVLGKSQGTITDANGRFMLNATPADSLEISYVGYQTRVVAVKDRLDITVTLLANQGSLNEVVVVGYGEQKKASVVAAISSIDATQVIQSPTSNVAIALAGRLPGLTVLQRSGEPGANAIDLFIRGRSTLNEQRPLLMVDGVERDFNDIDPHEIETISILKDASATAVYGVRGANGVILVTTKRGKAGKANISVTMDQSIQAPTRLPKMVSAYQYAQLSNQVQESIGGVPAFTAEELEHYRLGDEPEKYPVRDFMNEFTKDFSPMTKVNVNVSGGSEKMRYFTSVGMMEQKGLFKTEPWDKYDYDAESKTKRFNFRSNIDIDLTNSLKMFLNIAGDIEKKNDPVVFAGGAGGDNYYLVMAKLLSTPNLAYNDLTPDGEVITSTQYAVGGATQTPYGYLNRSGFKVADRNNITSTLGVEQKLDIITPGLSVRAVVSYDAYTINEQRRKRDYAVYEASISGDSVLYTKLGSSNNTPLVDEQAQSFTSLFNIDASLNYARTFGASDVTGMILFNRNQRLINIDLPYNYVGLVGRGTYAYRGKYLAELNFGYNGSEQFAPNKQFGFFPSLSVGWIATEEPFLKDAHVLDFLKIRFSYGKVGNDRMESARFLYLDDWSTGEAWPGLPAGYYEQSIANKNISWEVSNKLNMGIESRFLNSFSLNLDLFYEIRNNILLRDGGATPGFMFGQPNLPPVNDGEVENKGLEIELGYQKQFNQDIGLLVKLNGAYNKNRINYVNEVQLPEDYAYRTRSTGYSIGQMFGYKTAGFFNSTEDIEKWPDQTPLGAPPQPGDIKYVDINGDGQVDVRDVAPIGLPNVPEVTFGGAANITFLHFDASVMFQGATRRSYYMNDRGTWETQGNFTEWHLEAWTPEKYQNHEKITYPRLVPGGNSNHLLNNFWVIDGSYIRLKNAEIGYTLPQSLSGKISASHIRIYLTGFNLLTWDHFPKKYFDPEQANQLSYPLWKVYNAGINVTF